jgi:mannosyltransferase OCH1-like enzyme
MIPKIIHYCWVSREIPETIPETIPKTIPENFRQYIQTWKKLSGYQFMLWNFKRFDINSSIWVKEAWETGKYAFVADYMRLYAVYNFGGIYLDMDIEVLKPFDEFLQYAIMIAYEQDENKTFESGCFGAEKGSPYIKKCLDYYKDRHFIKTDGSYDTLPIPLIMKELLTDPFKNDDITIYSSDYFTVKNFITGTLNITNNTYCIHHFTGSWLTEQQKEDNKIVHNIYKKFGDTILSKCLKVLALSIRRIKHDGIIPAIRVLINRAHER